MSAADDRFEVVEFAIGADLYSIAVASVAEIISIRSGAATVRIGSISARVVEAAELLGSGSPPPNARRRGIVLGKADAPLILAVDSVSGISTVERSVIVPPPDRFSGPTGQLVEGLVPHGAGMRVLIDSAALIERATAAS